MAMEGLLALACAGALLMTTPPTTGPAPAVEDKDSTVASILAVQTAMQQGRDLLLHNNPRAAVETLERQLARINGNSHYLALLRDAYRAYIKDLRLASQEVLAKVYQQRLGILEPASAPDTAALARGTPAATATSDPAVKPPIVR